MQTLTNEPTKANQSTLTDALDRSMILCSTMTALLTSIEASLRGSEPSASDGDPASPSALLAKASYVVCDLDRFEARLRGILSDLEG